MMLLKYGQLTIPGLLYAQSWCNCIKYQPFKVSRFFILYEYMWILWSSYILHHMQVNTNGHISFRSPFFDHNPRQFPLAFPPLIAPYWAHFDSPVGGTISYRQTSNSSLLQRVRGQIQESFPSAGNFIPTDLFNATWDQVPEFFPRSLIRFHDEVYPLVFIV